MENVTLFGLLFTTSVTILGWLYTAYNQQKILEETRKSQNLDRELAVFRERLGIIRGITATLLDLRTPYIELFASIQSGQFAFEAGALILQNGNTHDQDFLKILYDPAFRSMLELLPEEKCQGVYDQLEKVRKMISDFHVSAVDLSPGSTPGFSTRLSVRANSARLIAEELIKTANLLADEFAFLDKSLASGK